MAPLPHVVRAAVVQAAPVAFSTARALKKVEALARQAAGLIVFPEAFVSAYPRGSTFGAVVGNRTPEGREEYRTYWDNTIDVSGPAVGIQLYCAPTAHARDTWIAPVQHIALEGRCFVLSCNRFCLRSDYPPHSETPFGDDPDTVVCRGELHRRSTRADHRRAGFRGGDHTLRRAGHGRDCARQVRLRRGGALRPARCGPAACARGATTGRCCLSPRHRVRERMRERPCESR